MTPGQFIKGLARMSVDVRQFTKEYALKVAGKTASDFFAQNFDRQGFLNHGLKLWKDVKRRTHPRDTPRGETAAGRRILFGETRNLSRSIDYDVQPKSVTVYSDVHYAPYHNEGTDRLPKRQFIGDSAELDTLITSEIERKLKNIIK
jgi:phage gpG-like protein